MLEGAAQLQCFADLETPVVRANDRHWLCFDAVTFSTNLSGERRPVRCLFHYCREDDAEVVEAGSYAILASVRATVIVTISRNFMVSHFSRLWVSVKAKIVRCLNCAVIS
jgi:hypothetical protein